MDERRLDPDNGLLKLAERIPWIAIGNDGADPVVGNYEHDADYEHDARPCPSAIKRRTKSPPLASGIRFPKNIRVSKTLEAGQHAPHFEGY
jgi:hypothetical protein